MEAHQGADGALWYRVSFDWGVPEGTINWPAATPYESSGLRPALSNGGFGVLEVDQVGSSVGVLRYRSGGFTTPPLEFTLCNFKVNQRG